MSSDGHLLSISDLADDDIDGIFQRADALAAGSESVLGRIVAGLLFLTPSLRTRIGYAVAAHRLGGSAVTVDNLRFGPGTSAAESLRDTIATLSGMVDILVVRSPNPLTANERAGARCPLISGGDGDREHPTQALIDLYAIERLRGPIGSMRLAMCGDLTMRSARSLLELLARRPPASLRLISPARRADHGVTLGHDLETRTSVAVLDDLEDIDVFYVAGLPPLAGDRHLNDVDRQRYTLSPRHLQQLPPKAVILSPLPLIDEITDEGRLDSRIRVSEQGDLGMWVRMAVLERTMAPSGLATST